MILTYNKPRKGYFSPWVLKSWSKFSSFGSGGSSGSGSWRRQLHRNFFSWFWLLGFVRLLRGFGSSLPFFCRLVHSLILLMGILLLAPSASSRSRSWASLFGWCLFTLLRPGRFTWLGRLHRFDWRSKRPRWTLCTGLTLLLFLCRQTSLTCSSQSFTHVTLSSLFWFRCLGSICILLASCCLSFSSLCLLPCLLLSLSFALCCWLLFFVVEPIFLLVFDWSFYFHVHIVVMVLFKEVFFRAIGANFDFLSASCLSLSSFFLIKIVFWNLFIVFKLWRFQDCF